MVISYVVALCFFFQITIAYRCCAPKQFETVEGFAIGTDGGHFNGAQGKVSYDAVNQRLAYTFMGAADGHAYNVTIVQDYKKKIMYQVTNGHCITTKLISTFQVMCVPDNATLTGSSYLGGPGDALKYTGYTQTLNDEARVGNVYYSVTNKQCIFIGGSMTGLYNGKTGFMATYGFSGTTIGIKDPSVFAKPKSCSNKPQQEYAFVSSQPHLIHLNSNHILFI